MGNGLRSLVIIDDNEGDISILRVVIEKAGVQNPVRGFGRAEDAMAFLSNAATDESSRNQALPLACLVDVKMTGFDGFEFIEWVRNHRVFDRMALLVVSCSDDPCDLSAAAKRGAQCYVAKYPTATAVRALVQGAEQFSAMGTGREAFAFWCILFLGRKPLLAIEGEGEAHVDKSVPVTRANFFDERE